MTTTTPDFAGWATSVRERYSLIKDRVGGDLNLADLAAIVSASSDVRVAHMLESWLEADPSPARVRGLANLEVDRWTEREQREALHVSDGPLSAVMHAESVGMVFAWRAFVRGLGESA